jgi:adenine-specific DNA-methyltransferase
MKKQKLELTWLGKDERPKLEPRILIEDSEKSYHAKKRVGENDIFDNRLIFGDNLLALKALEQEFAGKVKCIYIDPPFNTGQAFEHYDDGIEHSLWLSLMHERIKILHTLLSDDGLFWMHLDDIEVHYAKVVLDEIFGRDNFIADITYERSGAAGLGLGGFVVTTGERILTYKKNRLPTKRVLSFQQLEEKTMKRYNKALIDEGTRELVDEFISKSNQMPVKLFKHKGFTVKTISMAKFEARSAEIEQEFVEYFPFLFRTNQIQKENSFQRDLVGRMDKTSLYTVEYTPSRGKNEGVQTKLHYLNAELFAWLKDTAAVEEDKIVKSSSVTNVWSHGEIPKADLQNEGGIDFPRSKKPEKLLQRIIEMSSEPGDWILDSFAGSGTTGCTAHKMHRKWIMVELGEHCHTHITPRLMNVIGGSDQRGISKDTNWQGGGGFRYYRLAPSLLEKDSWGNWVISKEFNSPMLAEAVCKLNGFTYAPSDTNFWQHGRSTERDYIYVTTQTLTREQLAKISEEVGESRSLLICCGAFRVKADAFPNLTLRKIPKAVLTRCEWGRDDYSLKVNELPIQEAITAISEPEKKAQKQVKSEQERRATQDQLGLFERGK